MDPEQLTRLERIEAKLDELGGQVAELVSDLARWRAVLPDPDTLKARIGRRRVGRAAVDFLSEE